MGSDGRKTVHARAGGPLAVPTYRDKGDVRGVLAREIARGRPCRLGHNSVDTLQAIGRNMV